MANKNSNENTILKCVSVEVNCFRYQK